MLETELPNIPVYDLKREGKEREGTRRERQRKGGEGNWKRVQMDRRQNNAEAELYPKSIPAA